MQNPLREQRDDRRFEPLRASSRLMTMALCQ
jgi:hypothetical protein